METTECVAGKRSAVGRKMDDALSRESDLGGEVKKRLLSRLT